ncbi:MAG: hypothetical protein K9J81_01375, partial [Desulfohalobiaceae bacterium]|nr:hypothetical protein [Desulfohalobiaceae bacterium]
IASEAKQSCIKGQNEHRTSNVERRTANDESKKRHTHIPEWAFPFKQLALHSSFFFIQSSMFDVRCSTFKFCLKE